MFDGGLAMSKSSRDSLLQLLLETYPDLQVRLARRLGSRELASEALQDTYLRLRRREVADEVRNPRSYLFRMALNIASNRTRAEARHLSSADIATLIEVADEAPTPESALQAKAELAAIERALTRLPERRRRIFLRCWVDGVPHAQLAEEFALSVRTIRHELQLATEHLHRVTRGPAKNSLPERRSPVSSD